MKKISLLIFLSLNSCATPLSQFNQIDYIREEKQFDRGNRSSVISYTYYGDQCSLAYEVSALRNKGEKNKYLRVIYPKNIICKLPFEKAKQLHLDLLNQIFKEFPAKQFSHFNFSMLNRLNTSGSWNEELKKLSLTNNDWLDWVKHYPHHKSKKSSNQIYLESFVTSTAYEDIKSLFSPFNLKLEIEGVEKVFAVKNRNGKRVFYDSGIHWFKLDDSK